MADYTPTLDIWRGDERILSVATKADDAGLHVKLNITSCPGVGITRHPDQAHLKRGPRSYEGEHPRSNVTGGGEEMLARLDYKPGGHPRFQCFLTDAAGNEVPGAAVEFESGKTDAKRRRVDVPDSEGAGSWGIYLGARSSRSDNLIHEELFPEVNDVALSMRSLTPREI